ncbi:MAG: fructosamine kinase family protein [Gammaproteobacteria bacterium]|nr:fructosamine kinase family protein [Gammaproteobacteria bacterium]
MTHWQAIAEHISQSLNKPFQIQQTNSVGGGSINSAYKVSGINGQSYFVKFNSASLEHMFQVEFDSLNELSNAPEMQTSAMQIPSPICFGTTGSKSYLVLEYLTMSSRGDGAAMGHALSQMHRITAAQYGWYQNNIIGSTPQSNQQHSDWLSFWREERMIPQLKMLYDKGYKQRLLPLSDRLLNKLDSLLGSHNPPASLLHGDLWSGNYAYDKKGQPVIFDPALYYGDRESDLAMTELFGGFGQDFYRAYNEAWPLDEAYNTRKTLYNLYHILNHANLFGTSYLNQAISMMDRLC